MQQSCLAKHFQQFALLSPQDLHFLESLDVKPESWPRNANIWREGSDASHFYVLNSGWAYSSRILQDGSRQILDIFVPGDIIGLRDLACRQRLNAAHTVTEVELCAFPQHHLRALFQNSSALGQLFFSLAAQGQALLAERIINLGRRSARQRVAHVLAELSTRLEESTAENVQRDVVPLSQTLLADLLGLSAVHINRTIRGLREDRLIDLQYQSITLLDVVGLKEVSGFNPAYLRQEFVPHLPDATNGAVAIDKPALSFRSADTTG